MLMLSRFTSINALMLQIMAKLVKQVKFVKNQALGFSDLDSQGHGHKVINLLTERCLPKGINMPNIKAVSYRCEQHLARLWLPTDFKRVWLIIQSLAYLHSISTTNFVGWYVLAWKNLVSSWSKQEMSWCKNMTGCQMALTLTMVKISTSIYYNVECHERSMLQV